MPTYEYVCTDCQNHWEEVQKISEPARETCPKCDKRTAKRQISGGNFILKGGGWYADLYSSAPKNGAAKSESKSESKAEGTNASSPSSSSSSSSSSSTSSTTSSTPSSVPAAKSESTSPSKS